MRRYRQPDCQPATCSRKSPGVAILTANVLVTGECEWVTHRAYAVDLPRYYRAVWAQPEMLRLCACACMHIGVGGGWREVGRRSLAAKCCGNLPRSAVIISPVTEEADILELVALIKIL